MKDIAHLIDRIMSLPEDEAAAQGVRKSVGRLVKKFPLYKNLIRRLEKE